jgi:hypothetical protein
MRKLGTAVAALALAVAGLAIPATTAQADDISPQGPVCDDFPSVSGYMYAWRDLDCRGELLGYTQGDDANWADGSGAFSGSDHDAASSVMNAGVPHYLDVVAFYNNVGYDFRVGGYGCLSRGEYYADDLRDNSYRRSDGSNTGVSLHDTISSHRWVNASGCHPNSWIT